MDVIGYRISLLCCFILSFTFCAQGFAQTSSAEPAECAIISLHGEVDFAMSSFTQRSTKTAAEAGVSLIIFDIDTFGGRVDSALEISKTITDLTNIKTVAYISVKAISAGALISLSCNEIIMKENTTLGDCAPISVTQEGPKMLGEKFQSPLRAEFRKLAEHNGYPVSLAEAMVTQEVEVYKVIYNDGHHSYLTGKEIDALSEQEQQQIYKKTTIVDDTQLLTIHDQEALDLGFARQVVKDEQELLDSLDVESEDIMRLEFTWSEKFVRILEKLTPILMLIGMLALYTELKVPGVGLPGLVALICFGLVFGSKIFVGLASYTELLLFVTGLVLILLELFVIPGFGIAGISGILLLIVSLFLASQSFVIPTVPWQFELTKTWVMQFSLVLIGFFVGALLLGQFLPRTSIAKRIALQTELSGEQGFSDVSIDYTKYLNQEGIAISMLRPAGKAKFGDDLLDVICDAGFLAQQTPIRVIRVDGKKIFVEEVTQA